MQPLKAALRARLVAGGVSAPVHDTQAPAEAPYPFIILHYTGGGDENRTRLNTRNETWLVKALSDDHATAHTLAADIRAALHQQALTVAGWGHLWTAQIEHVWQVENVARRQVFHAGGVFRVRLFETP
ncbi:MAG: DUF3168 domain-containing protein [Anaerolineales bacterium]